MVPANTALRLRAVLEFQADDGTKRVAGDEWLFEGPGVCVTSVASTYICVYLLCLKKEGCRCEVGLVH